MVKLQLGPGPRALIFGDDQMKILRNLSAVALLLLTRYTGDTYGGLETDRDSLHRKSEAIRAAFASGDVATITAYHHPDVIKALSFRKYLTGRDAVEPDPPRPPQHFNLQFEQNQ